MRKEPCEVCKDVTDFDLLWAVVVCANCGRGGAHLLPEIKASRGVIDFFPVIDQ